MSNELTLIDQFVDLAQRGRDQPFPGSVAFEIFAAQCALAGSDITNEEIEAGIIGGGGDGGIDAFYVFVNGELVAEDSTVLQEPVASASARREPAAIRVVLIQAKRETSYTETAIDKADSALRKLLDLEYQGDLAALYGKELLKRRTFFTSAWKNLTARRPSIHFDFFYATRATTERPNRAVKQKADDLAANIHALVPQATTATHFQGAAELYAAATASPPTYDLTLNVDQYTPQGDAFACFVKLSNYAKFLTNDDGSIRSHLFDWNVRDYQGPISVNREIQDSLSNPAEEEDFWWLNNGVTILCSRVIIGARKVLTLDDVQIVNGLQTSHSIYAVAQQDESPFDDDRSVLVRIIQTTEPETRDRIIRATNRQTSVPTASLHATEVIHRQLEQRFLHAGWYYDRRKNFYRNQGKPADRIVSINALAQAVMSMGLSRPNDARARPTTLLVNSADYSKIFNEQVSLDTYLWCATNQRRIDAALRLDYEPAIRTDLRFYVSSFLVIQALGKQVRSPKQLKAITGADLDLSDLPGVIQKLTDIVVLIAEWREWTFDRAAKSKHLRDFMIRVALAPSHLVELKKIDDELRAEKHPLSLSTHDR